VIVLIPSYLNSSLNTSVLNLIRVAIYLRPVGECQIAYKAVILARRACDVQILDVALSLRICYSRTWSVILKAVLPSASLEIPMILPGIFLLNSSLTAK
jgi:hypothetical protein